MKVIIKTVCIIVIAVTSVSCSTQKQITFTHKEVYKSKVLRVTQVAENSFQHTSFLQTQDFGNVPCNGLVVRNNNEAIIFDTPTNDESSNELIQWIKQALNCKINAVIPTHFHDDCLGGLKAFHEHNISSYAYARTTEFAREKNFVIPQNSFKDSLNLQVGTEIIIAQFFGEGHTQDNIIGYFPADKVMFGGCLIKESGAGKGYLGDANVAVWSATVEKIKKRFPDVKMVVPGHGKCGNIQLLDYTADLFRAP